MNVTVFMFVSDYINTCLVPFGLNQYGQSILIHNDK